MSSAEDARHRTLDYLTSGSAALVAANMLKDDAATQLVTHVMFSDPDIPVKRLFYDKAVDVFFCIGTPESTAIVDWDGSIIGYREHVPITIFSIDTLTVTGTKARWTCERELRRVVETYPISSTYRSLDRVSDNEQPMGGWTLYSVKYILTYERDTT